MISLKSLQQLQTRIQLAWSRKLNIKIIGVNHFLTEMMYLHILKPNSGQSNFNHMKCKNTSSSSKENFRSSNPRENVAQHKLLVETYMN